MFTKFLQNPLEKESPTEQGSMEKLREFNAELERRVAERIAGLETANAELRRHVAGREGVEDQLKTSLREVADLKAALDEHAIVAMTNPQGKITYVNHKFCTISSNVPRRNSVLSAPMCCIRVAVSEGCEMIQGKRPVKRTRTRKE